MAELIDGFPDDAEVHRLRLVIRWVFIDTDPALANDLVGEFSIGLFMGNEPLFTPLAYQGKVPISQRQEVGFFHGESDGCRILFDLQQTILTGETVVIEDFVEPWIKLVIGEDLFRSHAKTAQASRRSEYFEVLAIIQHGGPWEDGAMGSSGPAAMLSVKRVALEGFFLDLLNEALNPKVSNEASLVRLREMFGDVATQSCGAGPQ